jgi:hypothetical protein
MGSQARAYGVVDTFVTKGPIAGAWRDDGVGGVSGGSGCGQAGARRHEGGRGRRHGCRGEISGAMDAAARLAGGGGRGWSCGEASGGMPTL